MKKHITIKSNASNYYLAVLLRSFQLLCFGISALQRFIQSNWLGYNKCEISSDDGMMDSASKENLILDAECLFPTIKDLQLLLAAKTILYDFKEKFMHLKVIQTSFKHETMHWSSLSFLKSSQGGGL